MSLQRAKFFNVDSRRAEAITTSREIHPVRISEIEQAVGQVKTLQGDPVGVSQVRSGFDHDGDVCGPRDVEAESAGSNPKARIAGLHQRIPEQSRATGNRIAPTGRAGKIIDGGAGVIERRRTEARSVAWKKTPARLLQELNAKNPRLVTVAGIVTLVRLMES